MIRKRYKLMFMVIGLLIVIIAGAIAAIVMQRKQLSSYADQVTQLEGQINTNTKTVYVASMPITAGDRLTEDNVMQQRIYSDSSLNNDSSLYMTADDVGKKALININMNAPIQKSMLTDEDITDDERNYEVGVVNLTTDQKANDIVDVRIMYPDGTDYIVLAKKQIRDLSGSIFNFYLDESEILTLDSATVDCATLGAHMYTTRYIEPTLQQDAIPFYPVKQSTIDLISSDPNVLRIAKETISTQVRQDLEERMMQLKKDSGSDSLSSDFQSQISVSGSSTPVETSADEDEEIVDTNS